MNREGSVRSIGAITPGSFTDQGRTKGAVGVKKDAVASIVLATRSIPAAANPHSGSLRAESALAREMSSGKGVILQKIQLSRNCVPFHSQDSVFGDALSSSGAEASRGLRYGDL